MKTLFNRSAKVSLLCAALLTLQGCAVAVVGATAVGVKSATDRRSIGTQLDDQTVELRAQSAIDDVVQLEGSRVVIVGFNDSLLMVGQTPTEDLRRLANNTARNVEGVKQVHNELRLGNPVSLMARSKDTWLTGKVKTKLLSESSIDGSQVKVVTENAEVFLLGILSAEEEQTVVELTRNVSGVERVVTAIDRP